MSSGGEAPWRGPHGGTLVLGWRRKFCGPTPRAQSDVGGLRVTYNALISACERGARWQSGLSFLRELLETSVEANVRSYNAMCGTCVPWQHALVLLGEMSQARIDPGAGLSAGINSCEKGGNKHHTLSLFNELVQSASMAMLGRCHPEP
ncbi:unnamed protein product [Prorocentrum cordatum]|uniref:Pentatricopeptide repeat-containing protein n=1 Tax=Prorocentrum cordatum TaxID=2364126 RepID=A0ABN9SUL7_9DINO|nr:unnamed protein product [Polarella glacialis]